MAVYKDGKPVPGTERKPTRPAVVRRRREHRRKWKANRSYNENGYSTIYGWRHKETQHK